MNQPLFDKKLKQEMRRNSAPISQGPLRSSPLMFYFNIVGLLELQ
jgi:hypothetical protein